VRRTALVGSLAFIRNLSPCFQPSFTLVILAQQNNIYEAHSSAITIPGTSAQPFEVIFCGQDFSLPEEFLIVSPYLITN
jgi:hypothetical protein